MSKFRDRGRAKAAIKKEAARSTRQPATPPAVVTLAGGYELHPHYFVVTGWNAATGEPMELKLIDKPPAGQVAMVLYANRPWLASMRLDTGDGVGGDDPQTDKG